MKAHVADGGRGRLSGRVITLSAALFLAGTAGAQCLTSEFGVPGEFLGAQDGRSVAVDGDLLVVGAPYSTESLGAPQSGAAFVFERRSGDWVQTARLAPDDAAQAQRFGWSVAISGERIAVGAPWDPLYTHQSFPPGAAYLFERTGDAWAQTAKVVGSGAEANAMLGWSVALDGDVLAVGGPLQVALGSGATGRVWIFERAGAA